MAIVIPNRRVTTVLELARDFIRLVQQLGAGAEGRLLLEQTVGTSQTALAHGMRDAPRAWFAQSRTSGVTVYRSQDPDNRNIYATASAEAEVDFLIIP